MRLGLAAVAVLCAGCLQSSAVLCNFGTCPAGYACDETHAVCVVPDQLTECADKLPGESCQVSGQGGTCTDGVCLFSTCGDGIVSGAEQCDGEVFSEGATTCTDIGYYAGGELSCNANCTFNTVNCSRYCGDGIQDPEETCDPGEDGTVTCESLGFYAGEAVCTAACTVDYSTCARCGDGVISHGEACELGELVPPITCTQFGYDYGRADCSASCGPTLATCGQFAFAFAGPIEANYQPGEVWMAGEDDAYVVGLRGLDGVLSHWDGVALTDVTMTETYDAISGSGNYVVTVGPGGILTYDGTNIVRLAQPVGRDVHVFGPNDAVIITKDRVYRFDGSAVTEIQGLPVSGVELHAVWGTSADDLWVVGGLVTGTDSVIIHVVDGVAQRFDVSEAFQNEKATLLGVWGSSANDVYFVGDGGQALHWTGGTTADDFRILDLPPRPEPALPDELRERVMFVEGTGPADVRITDRTFGDIFQWDGLAWSRLALGGAVANVQSTSSADATEVYGVTLDGLVRMKSAQLGVIVNAPQNTLSVAAVPGAGLFATGVAPGQGVRRFDGDTWDVSSTVNATHVWGAGPSAVFAASPDDLQHFDGSWQTQSIADPDGAIVGMWGTSGSDVYVTTNAGTRWHFDGTSWTTLSPEPSGELLFATGSAANNQWVSTKVTQTIQRFDGTSWITVHTNATDVHDMVTFGPADTYAIGDGVFGVQHWNGSTWTKLELPSNELWTSIDGTASNDVWLTGQTTVLHWNGVAWYPVRMAAVGNVEPNILATERAIYKWHSRGTENRFEVIIRRCTTCL